MAMKLRDREVGGFLDLIRMGEDLPIVLRSVASPCCSGQNVNFRGGGGTPHLIHLMATI